MYKVVESKVLPLSLLCINLIKYNYKLNLSKSFSKQN